MHHGMPLTLVLRWMSHGMSTSHVRSMSMIDPSLGLSNRMVQSAGWRAAPLSSLRRLRTSWIFLSPVRSFLCHSHRMDNLCFHHRDIGI